MSQLIVSFITNDKPGIVNTLSDIVKQHNGNWKKSCFHHLSGVFAGIIEIECSPEQVTSLSNVLSLLPDFKINIEQVTASQSEPDTQITLELTANDRQGIVQEIAATIVNNQGNLLKLISNQLSAPHAGNEIFKAQAVITCHDDNLNNLIVALENLADDLMVDISK